MRFSLHVSYFSLCNFTMRKYKYNTFDVRRLAIQRLEIAKNDLQHRIAKEVCLFSSLFCHITLCWWYVFNGVGVVFILGKRQCNFTSKLREKETSSSWTALGTWTRCNIFLYIYVFLNMKYHTHLIYCFDLHFADCSQRSKWFLGHSYFASLNWLNPWLKIAWNIVKQQMASIWILHLYLQSIQAFYIPS
jgi:hypothetical protein